MAPVFIPLLALILIQMTASGAFVTVQVVAPEVAPSLGLPAQLIGFFTAIAYTGAIFATATGTFVGRLGGLRVCQLGLLLCGVGLALCAMSNLLALTLGAVLLGIGHAPVTPASAHILARRTPPAIRSSIFSIKQAAVPLGGVLAGVLVPLVALGWGWQAGVLSMALLCAATALLVQPARRDLDSDRAPSGPRLSTRVMVDSVRVVLDHRPLRRLVVAGCVFGALQWCFGTFFVAYLVVEQGVALVVAGLAFSVAQAAGVVGRVAWGVVADRWSAPRPVLGGLGLAMAAASVGIAAVSPAWPGWALLLLAGAVGLTAISWNGVVLAEIARLAPQGQVAAATSGFVFLFAVSTILTPIAFSVLALVGSYAVGYLVVAAACAWAGWDLLRRG